MCNSNDIINVWQLNRFLKKSAAEDNIIEGLLYYCKTLITFPVPAKLRRIGVSNQHFRAAVRFYLMNFPIWDISKLVHRYPK